MSNQKVYTYYFRKKRKYDLDGNKIQYDNSDTLPEDLKDKHLTIIIDYNDIYGYITNNYHEFLIDFYDDNVTNNKSIIKDFNYENKLFKEYNKYEEFILSNVLDENLSYINPPLSYSGIDEPINTNNPYKIYNNVLDYKNDYIDDIDNIYREYQVDEDQKLFYIPLTKYEEIIDGINRYLNGEIYIFEVLLNKLPNNWSYAIDKEENLSTNNFFYSLNDIKNQLNRLNDQ